LARAFLKNYTLRLFIAIFPACFIVMINDMIKNNKLLDIDA
jgi:hypothetical protein